MGIAARFGHWSARHRGKAIGLWILFVVAAAMVGGAVGKSKLTLTESATGDSAAALRALDHANFERPASEQVLVQTRGADSVLDIRGRAAITQVVRAVSSTGRVYDVRSPLAPGNAAQVTHDRHSAVVLFSIKGKAETADKRVGPVVAAVQRVQDT
jgi:putative drug exporter of the RND superfamily